MTKFRHDISTPDEMCQASAPLGNESCARLRNSIRPQCDETLYHRKDRLTLRMIAVWEASGKTSVQILGVADANFRSSGETQRKQFSVSSEYEPLHPWASSVV